MGECAWWHECRAEAEYRVYSPDRRLDLDMCTEHRDEFVNLSGGYYGADWCPGGER